MLKAPIKTPSGGFSSPEFLVSTRGGGNTRGVCGLSGHYVFCCLHQSLVTIADFVLPSIQCDDNDVPNMSDG